MTDKRLMRVLQGEAVWPPPVWLMRQAGRYLPEFRAMRERADFLTRCLTPEIAVELTLQPIRRYGMDGAILFSDILILPWAMGQSLEFVDGEGPVMAPIRDEAALERLDPARIPEATAPVLEALRRLRAILDAPDGPGGGNTTLLGFTGAPFTVACYMVEGRGSREFASVRQMAYAQPELFERLIGLLEETTAAYLGAQLDAGAEAVMLFDSWAGLLAPDQFHRHVIEPTRRIVDRVRAGRPQARIIGFPRLAGLSLPEYAARTGVDVVGLDTGCDLDQVCELLPPQMGVQGNLDPLALLAGGQAQADAVTAIRERLRGRRHIFNLGHGVLQQTPPEHVAALVAQVRAA